MGTTLQERTMTVDVNLMGIVTDKLGTTAGDYTDVEIGKGVKMAANAYVVVVAGDEIEGIVNTVEPGTKNSGYNWGGIQTKGRAEATVGANQVGTVTIGAGHFLLNDTPIDAATAGLIQVYDEDGDGAAAPTKFLWRVIRILTGTGIAGDKVLIERA
jgi:hypothetical protein